LGLQIDSQISVDWYLTGPTDTIANSSESLGKYLQMLSLPWIVFVREGLQPKVTGWHKSWFEVPRKVSLSPIF